MSAYNDEADLKEMAKTIKCKLDVNDEIRGANDKGSWQCIVGKSFGSAFSYERSYCLMVKVLPHGKSVSSSKQGSLALPIGSCIQMH